MRWPVCPSPNAPPLEPGSKAGVVPFGSITKIDDQYTYFMGTSQAKQMLAIVHG